MCRCRHNVVFVREGFTRMYVDRAVVRKLDKASVRNVSTEQDFKIGVQEDDPGGIIPVLRVLSVI